MRKIIATAIVAVTLPFTFAGPAQATREIPGYPYPDVCKNVKGKQTIIDVLQGKWRFTGKNVCVKGYRN